MRLKHFWCTYYSKYLSKDLYYPWTKCKKSTTILHSFAPLHTPLDLFKTNREAYSLFEAAAERQMNIYEGLLFYVRSILGGLDAPCQKANANRKIKYLKYLYLILDLPNATAQCLPFGHCGHHTVKNYCHNWYMNRLSSIYLLILFLVNICTFKTIVFKSVWRLNFREFNVRLCRILNFLDF